MRRRGMKIIGVTGGLGTGKTTVAGMMAGMGGRVLDADRIAYKALQKGEPAYRRVVRLFGTDILDKAGHIDRGALAGKAFSSKRDVMRLNAIVHPRVRRVIRGEIRAAKKKARIGRPGSSSRCRALIIDAPLLIEAGIAKWMDALVVVTAGARVRTARSVKKGKLTPHEIRRRSRRQLPLKEKERLADFIIDNNGSLKRTGEQVKKAWKEIVNG